MTTTSYFLKVIFKDNLMTQKIISFLLAAFLLSGCMVQSGLGQVGRVSGQAEQATFTPAAPLPTSTPRPTRVPRATATPTTDPTLERAAQAEEAARSYFNALASGDFEAASNQLSQFALSAAQISAGDALAALQKQAAGGAQWSDLKVIETRNFDKNTMLVKVEYTRKTGDQESTASELWPMRLENGTWRYNWNNLIDYRTLDVAAQSVNDITVKPVQLRRYSDKMQLVLIMQNRSSETFVFGQPNEILGTFQFGDTSVEAVKTQIILLARRTAPSILLDAPGLYEQYPDSITIRKWVNLQVPPWYVFELQ